MILGTFGENFCCFCEAFFNYSSRLAFVEDYLPDFSIENCPHLSNDAAKMQGAKKETTLCLETFCR